MNLIYVKLLSKHLKRVRELLILIYLWDERASAKALRWEYVCLFDEAERGQRAGTKKPKGEVTGVEVTEVTNETVHVGLYKSWSKRSRMVLKFLVSTSEKIKQILFN